MMSSVNVLGSRPWAMARATTANARPGSCSMKASTNSSRGVASGASPPLAAARSRAEGGPRGRSPAAGRDQLEGRDRVACRAATLTQHRLHRCIGDFDTGIGGEPTNVLLEHIHRQEMKLQMLCATANRLADLLWVRGREHEHHVRRGLLERL